MTTTIRNATANTRQLLLIARSLLLLSMMLIYAPWATAESEIEKAQYVKIKPSITTNYISERLRYVQADVAIKVRGDDSVSAVEAHIPRIKHQLIMVLSRQEYDGVSTQEGRAIIKELALEEINTIMDGEGLRPTIEEVLFTGFIVE